MRSLLALVGLATWLSIPGPLFAAASGPPANHVAIQVAPGDWGSARVEDIATVLNSVVEVLLPYFPQQAPKRLVVASSQQGPHVVLERSAEGEYLVSLSVRDARWDQFAYQFSHELCHVFANHERHEPGPDGVTREHQWFEEALCEMVSLFTLGRMASSWESAPPYPHWNTYAPAFREYAERLQAQQHRHLSPTRSLQQWVEENRAQLKRDPYLRQKNELLATLLLPVFEQNPEGLAAIGYLNSEESASSRSLEEYLETWYECCPERHRSVVRQAISLFRRMPSTARSV